MRHRRRYQVVILATLFLLSCTKEKGDIRLSSFQTPVITGFLLKDNSGNTTGFIGSPNIKLTKEGKNFNTINVTLVMYPNPIRNLLSIYINASRISDAKIWITKAIFKGDPGNTFNFAGSSLAVNGGYPVFQKANINSNSIILDLGNLEDGYYRVYLYADDCLFWDNLIVSKHYHGYDY